jgi:hypothetical protein
MTGQRQDDLHREFRTLVMLLQLVTYIDHGSPTLLSDANGNAWHQVTFRSEPTLTHQDVLDATANLLVRNREIVAVTAGSSNGQVLSLFAMQDAPNTGVPLNNFAAVHDRDNRAPYKIFPSGELDEKVILLAHGQSVWTAIIKNSWHGLTMG